MGEKGRLEFGPDAGRSDLNWEAGTDVTLLVEPAGGRWRVRAEGAVLGGKAGRTVGVYDDRDAAIVEAMTNGKQIEARGFPVRVVIRDPPRDGD